MKNWKKPNILIASKQQINSIISASAISCRHLVR